MLADNDDILETHGLVKEFRGFTAVDGLNLRVRRGRIHALIGPNGAGKTTVFNLLTKFLQPTRGTVTFNGHDITADSPAALARKGMVRSFQISAVFPQLSLVENVRVALQRKVGASYQFWRPERSLAHLDARAMELLEAVGLQAHARLQAGELPYGRKRALELATTLATEPELLLLDEPTQGMGHEDIEQVTELIAQVAVGRTVLMVEHNMSVIECIADTVSVLQRGRVIAEGAYAEVSVHPHVLEAYMGSEDTEIGELAGAPSD